MTANDHIWGSAPGLAAGDPYALLGVAAPTRDAAGDADDRLDDPSHNRLTAGPPPVPGDPPETDHAPQATADDEGETPSEELAAALERAQAEDAGSGGMAGEEESGSLSNDAEPTGTSATQVGTVDGAADEATQESNEPVSGEQESGDPDDDTDQPLDERHEALYARHADGDYDDLAAEVVPFDFRSAAPLDNATEKLISTTHDRFLRRLSTSLSLYIGAEAWARLSSIQVVRVSQYMESVSDSVIFANVRLMPRGIGAIWEWGAGVGFAMIERLLGGEASFDHEARHLTGIELTISRKLTEQFTENLAFALDGSQSEYEIGMATGDADRLTIGPPTDLLVHIAMELGFDGGSGPFSLAYPLTDWKRPEEAAATTAPVASEQMARMLDDAAIEMRVDLGQASLTLDEISGIQLNDVIRLDQRVDQDVVLRVAKQARFTGKPGKVAGRRAVRITRVLEEET